MASSHRASEWTEVQALLRDTDPQTLFPFSGVQGDLPTHIAFALSKFGHAVRLFEAVKLLLDDGLASPAAILTRSLMTETLHLMEVARVAEPRRAALLLGWSNHSLERQILLTKEADRLGLGATVDAIAVLEERRQKIQRYQQRRGVPKLERFGSEKDLARRHGHESDYWNFDYASNAVHGSEFATGGVRRMSDDTMGFFIRDRDEKWLTAIGLFAEGMVLDATRAMVWILDLPPQAAIEDLAARQTRARGRGIVFSER